ncbi:hypothetical protein, partial [Vibrio parahaemolyticus]|uniref:hypothetical protein n=1 Tax=Vibrio parahaemolyticus TaxID=670 RepID=UPI001E2D5028
QSVQEGLPTLGGFSSKFGLCVYGTTFKFRGIALSPLNAALVGMKANAAIVQNFMVKAQS